MKNLKEILFRRRWAVCLGGCLVLAIMGYLMTRPLLIAEGENGIIFIRSAEAGDELSIQFIHSVQKTKVIENHIVNAECSGFVLQSTKYQSFGVGLPFLASEGKFRTEGDYFIIDDFNRQFKDIILRAGIGTELTLIYGGKEYPVYQDVPVGGRIDIKLRRAYELF